jgi:3-phenylpropionate/trans-cinnamate dioxygenase ferredoxin subunit
VEIEVCRLEELPPGARKIAQAGEHFVCVYNLGGELYGIEDRCSHDDGPLCEGEHDPESGTVTCPRHGSQFDIRTGRALNLPAYLPVETFQVRVEDGVVKLELAS